MSEFCARLGVREMPVDFGLPVVPVALPCSEVSLHRHEIGNSPVQALPGKSAELNLSHVEPTAVFRGMMNLNSFCQPPGFLRLKCLVESGQTVRVEVVHDQTYLDGIWIPFVEHALDP